MATLTTTARFRQAKRDVVGSLDPLFPGVRTLTQKDNEKTKNFGLLQSRYMSSLPLQMTLFFNVCFLPVWFICTAFLLNIKLNREELQTIYQGLLCGVLLVFSLLEVVRLYLGYLGNLSEKVPELSGFWLLTLIQVPLFCFLTFYEKFLALPFELAINIVILCFLISQLSFGYSANKSLVKHQLNKFYLLQFTEAAETDDNIPETLQL